VKCGIVVDAIAALVIALIEKLPTPIYATPVWAAAVVMVSAISCNDAVDV
jgi:hypothetical protein